jgi:thioredoxin reductase
LKEVDYGRKRCGHHRGWSCRLSATIFTQPDGWSTLVLEGDWVGGQGAIAYILSNYPGFPPGDSEILLGNMEKQASREKYQLTV